MIFCYGSASETGPSDPRGSYRLVDAARDSAGYFFYHALPFGTQANHNPLNVIINGGYGILQMPKYDEYERKIFTFPYGDWCENVWQTVGHPLRTINEFGWWRFLSTEVLPLTLKGRGN